MSSRTQQYFAAEDLRMLKRVLDSAGLYDTPDSTSRLARLNAARHLIACFQDGIAAEMELKMELHRHLHQDLAERSVATELVGLQLWDNECGLAEAELSEIALSRPHVLDFQSRLVEHIMIGFPAFSSRYHSPGSRKDSLPGLTPKMAA